MILQRKVQTAEDLVVEVCGSLGCEQHDILNDSLQADFTQKRLRFLYHLSDSSLQPWLGTIAITAFLAFCSWLEQMVKEVYDIFLESRVSL